MRGNKGFVAVALGVAALASGAAPAHAQTDAVQTAGCAVLQTSSEPQTCVALVECVTESVAARCAFRATLIARGQTYAGGRVFVVPRRCPPTPSPVGCLPEQIPEAQREAQCRRPGSILGVVRLGAPVSCTAQTTPAGEVTELPPADGTYLNQIYVGCSYLPPEDPVLAGIRVPLDSLIAGLTRPSVECTLEVRKTYT